MRGPQNLLQMSDGTSPQLPRRFDRNIDTLGNLGICQAVSMTHLDNLLMTWRQLGNRLEQFLVKFGLSHQSARRPAFHGEGMFGSDRPGNFSGRTSPPGIAIPPRLVEYVATDDLRQPSAQLPVVGAAELANRALGFEQALLHDVRSAHLGLQVAAYMLAGYQDKVLPMLFAQGRPRLLVAGPGSVDLLLPSSSGL
jgi:hypothetical protein